MLLMPTYSFVHHQRCLSASLRVTPPEGFLQPRKHAQPLCGTNHKCLGDMPLEVALNQLQTGVGRWIPYLPHRSSGATQQCCTHLPSIPRRIEPQLSTGARWTLLYPTLPSLPAPVHVSIPYQHFLASPPK